MEEGEDGDTTKLFKFVISIQGGVSPMVYVFKDLTDTIVTILTKQTSPSKTK